MRQKVWFNDSSLDMPIVRLLEKMNELGFITEWSCCGYNYPNQGKRDHGNAYISFTSSFALVKKLRRACDGFWTFEYQRDNFWTIRTESRGNMLKKFAWPAMEKAVTQLYQEDL